MASFTLSVNTCEMVPLIAEFVQRAKVHGQVETERRIGRLVDRALFNELFEMTSGGNGELRARPTAEFDRVLRALW